MRNSKDRTVSLILSKLLTRKNLLSTERLILTTLLHYTKFLKKHFNPSKKQLKNFINEAQDQIDRYLKVKLYGFNSLSAYYSSLEK